ncbi:LmeA family phospholipid-binding protein [Streptomyces sp. TP-A0874]|uniref:LmeA family phospholipid-binding protein n=1 Tax=Streptomyces sp. TP-A0874 TaxID=549819 RepID=UPI0008531A29|nr:DUF2993 domain-containing protein [Streptomyces sp. TP-A0874]
MRALRIILILVVVLGGLFVAADRLAVNLAEKKAAEKIQSSQGLPGTPKVSIKGFPFLTQVISKKFGEVDLELDGIEHEAAGHTIRVSSLSARLSDVRIGGDFSSATAERATGTALIGYDDLTKAADENVTLGYGGKNKDGKGQVKVTANVPLPLGQSFEHSVVSTVSVSGSHTVRLRAVAIPASQIPGLEDMVREKIDMDSKIGGLPEELSLESVNATKDGIELTVSGKGVKLAG